MIGATPGVPPGLALGEGQVGEERCQGAFDLVGFSTQSMFGGAIIGTLAVETDVVGCGKKN